MQAQGQKIFRSIVLLSALRLKGTFTSSLTFHLHHRDNVIVIQMTLSCTILSDYILSNVAFNISLSNRVGKFFFYMLPFPGFNFLDCLLLSLPYKTVIYDQAHTESVPRESAADLEKNSIKLNCHS